MFIGCRIGGNVRTPFLGNYHNLQRNALFVLSLAGYTYRKLHIVFIVITI